MMALAELFDMVSVPAPVRVTAPPKLKSTPNPAELRKILPELLMVGPYRVKIVPSTMIRLSSLSIVRFPDCAPLKSIVTEDATPLPLSIKTLELELGTPALHLVESLHFPVPPFH